MVYKIGQLNIYDPHHSLKVGEILIQPGESSEEADLFIIVEIDSNTPSDRQFIKQLLEIAFETYEKTKIFEAERSLEKILQELNDNLPGFFPKKNYLSLCHFFIGLYQQGNLFFSVFGKINTYLIKPILIKKIETVPSEEETFTKIFNYTLNGLLKDNDKILITTESLTDYLSLEKIKKIIATLPPAGSVAHFTNVLQATPPTISFFSIIITAPLIKSSVDEIPMTLPKLSLTKNSKTSIDQLLAIKQETEKILKRPSLLMTLKDKIFIKEKTKIEKPLSTKISLLKLKKIFFPKLFGSFSKVFNFLLLSEVRKKFFTRSQQKFSALYQKIRTLSKVNKIFLLVVFILLLLFTQNLIWQTRKKSQLIDEQSYISQIQQIEEKQNSIEASLIYNDTNRAKQLLTEINQILENFPQDTKNRVNKKQELIQSTQKYYDKVWKVINIIEPLLLYDFKEMNLGASYSALGLKDKQFYILNSTNQIFLFNLDNNSSSIIPNLNLNLIKLSQTPNNLLIGLTTDKKFFSLTDTAATSINVSDLTANGQIDDFTFYLDKMYLLARSDKQIYRYSQVGNDYQNPRAWVKEDLPIDQLVSLTVDGYVYGLSADGQILLMANGKKQDYPKINIEPALTLATKIFTTPESDKLYILDPQNKRFLVINKEKNELINQYYSEKFNDLKDFVIDEKAGKVYLLNGSRLLVIGI